MLTSAFKITPYNAIIWVLYICHPNICHSFYVELHFQPSCTLHAQGKGERTLGQHAQCERKTSSTPSLFFFNPKFPRSHKIMGYSFKMEWMEREGCNTTHIIFHGPIVDNYRSSIRFRSRANIVIMQQRLTLTVAKKFFVD